jgi:hypothetical protein
MIPSDLDSRSYDEPTIPAIIRIGVTGHRVINDQTLIRNSIRTVLNDLTCPFSHTPFHLVALSALAEGADRIVADEILKYAPLNRTSRCTISSSLQAILPLPPEDYMKDFKTESSKNEFNFLLHKGRSPIELKPESTEETLEEQRRAAYEYAGRYIVHQSDILIAIWNGKKAAGRGGTEDIVRYARSNNRTCVWIHSETGTITWEKRGDNTCKSLEYLDQFNGEKVRKDVMDTGVEQRLSVLNRSARDVSLQDHFFDPMKAEILPLSFKASTLAKKYRTRHMRCGIFVYLLAAFAVTIVTFQVLFLPENPSIIVFEIASIGLVIMLCWVSRNAEWHKKWLDYRFLAEHLRTAIFLSTACVSCESEPRTRELSHRPRDWVIMAAEGICHKQPKFYCDLMSDNSHFVKVKKLVVSGWIDNQIDYYTQRGDEHRKSNERLIRVGVAFFVITFFASLFHFFGHSVTPSASTVFFINLVAALAIIFPAFGSSVAAIRNYNEYKRNSERYEYMVQHLTAIRNEIAGNISRNKFLSLLREANELMMSEHMDWRVLLRVRSIEV